MEVWRQAGIYIGFLAAVWAVYEVGVFLCMQKRRGKRRARENAYLRHMETIDGLLENFRRKPTEFERYVAMLFEAMGCEEVEVTKGSRDGGKDIVMCRDGERYVAEVKLYSPQYKISREKIQKLHSAMLDSEASAGCFVTTSSFTADAEEYAHRHGIDLVDGCHLASLVEDMEKGRTPFLPDSSYLCVEIEEGMGEEKDRDLRRLRYGAALLLFCYLVYGVILIGLAGTRSRWYETAFVAVLMALDLRGILWCFLGRGRRRQETVR